MRYQFRLKCGNVGRRSPRASKVQGVDDDSDIRLPCLLHDPDGVAERADHTEHHELDADAQPEVGGNLSNTGQPFCMATFGRRPVDYLADVGWMTDRVWLAHVVWPSPDEVNRLGAARVGSAHCPSSNMILGSGLSPVRELRAAGAPVGLGVDGAASNESGQLGSEIRAAVLMNRLRAGADRMSARQALSVATIGGARVLGRQDEIGSIEVGKLADLALWRIDGIEHAGIADPVAALALGAQPPLSLLLVQGRPTVREGRLVNADEDAIAREVARASSDLASRV